VADSPTQSADPGLPVGAPLDWCLKKLLPANPGCLLNLIRKELRLHQLSFFLAGLFCLVWLLVLIVIAWRLDDGQTLAGLVMAWFVAILVTTVGAVTIAEERHLGLLDWHRTLPFATGKQWLIKVAVALSLAAFLGLALPCLLGVATWGAEPLYQKLLVDPTGSLVMAGSILLLGALLILASFNYRRLRVGAFGVCLQLIIAGICAAVLLGGCESLTFYACAMGNRLAVEQQTLEERNRPAQGPPRPQNVTPQIR